LLSLDARLSIAEVMKDPPLVTRKVQGHFRIAGIAAFSPPLPEHLQRVNLKYMNERFQLHC
jgi:hypothetical protein